MANDWTDFFKYEAARYDSEVFTRNTLAEAVQGIYGGTAGSWNKQAPKLDEFELMVIAQRH